MEDEPWNDVMAFDFEDYFERSLREDLSPGEREDWNMRVMGLFCRSFIDSRGDPAAIPPWVANYVCEQFYKVLAGEEWERAFPLPWTTPTPIRSRSEESDLEIFCDIANTKRSDPERKITEVIREVADNHCVSYEKARAAWYARRKKLPDDFLSKDSVD